MKIYLSAILGDGARPTLDRMLASIWGFIDGGTVYFNGRDPSIPVICESYGLRVVQGPWLGYGPSRQVALEAAQCDPEDWLLFMDADQIWVGGDPRETDTSGVDALDVLVDSRGATFRLVKLARRRACKAWKGLAHNYLELHGTKAPWGAQPSVRERPPEGQDPTVHQRDRAELLERQVIEDPNNPRWWYYLGMVRRLLGQWTEAIQCYDRAIELGAFERFGALYERALCYRHLGPPIRVLKAFSEAIRAYPTRPEPCTQLAMWYLESGIATEALRWALQAVSVCHLPPQGTFPETRRIQDAYDTAARAANQDGQHGLAVILGELAVRHALPGHEKRLERNLEFYRGDLASGLAVRSPGASGGDDSAAVPVHGSTGQGALEDAGQRDDANGGGDEVLERARRGEL